MAFRLIRKLLLLVLSISFSSISYAESFECQAEKSEEVKQFICTQIYYDGLVVKNTIRFGGIETVRVGQQPYYTQANKMLNDLLANQNIRVETKDLGVRQKIEREGKQPFYERFIEGIVYRGGLNINMKLVQEGFATIKTSDEIKMDDQLIQNYAKNNKQGLWSAEPILTPPQFDQHWQQWQKQLPKLLDKPEVIECQIEDVTNSEKFYCYHKDTNGIYIQEHISYYQIWMPLWGNAQYYYQVENKLKKLMAHKKVTVQIYKIESDDIYVSRPTKRYRDVAGIVYVEGKNVGEEMLKVGLAATYPSREWPENPSYIALQNQAMQDKKGIWASKEISDSWFFRYERAEKHKMDAQRNLKISYIILYTYPVILLILICCILGKVRTDIALFILIIPLLAISFPVYIFLSSQAIMDTGKLGISDVAGMKIALLLFFGVIGAGSITTISWTIGGIVLIGNEVIKKKPKQDIK